MKRLEVPSVMIVYDFSLSRRRISADSKNLIDTNREPMGSLLVSIKFFVAGFRVGGSKTSNTSSMNDCLQPLRKGMSTLSILT